ncbi:diguanylate cyclase [Enterovibrio sp. ZSDZ35]|uniref:diguanylate cyclase n=1 Tax=Enterovibrio qingdaonensis TaxID=2899818 RepID=A0ABT5QGG5_9GAMM|nr:ABC transporter substrate binding protein [Enterovibrio sp. ZSDZ35]MDD1780073.1 diguanylate cyclase [Enterovibrio sp. ZSDZ35]
MMNNYIKAGLSSLRQHTKFIHVIFMCAIALPMNASVSASQFINSDSNAHHILYINSFHRGYGWSDELESGLRETFATSATPVELSVVYLDSRRFDPAEINNKVADILALKNVSSTIDLVVTSDADAIAFALENQKTLFPTQPIVFSSINGQSSSQLQDRANVTGISEYKDYLQSLELALSLHPQTQAIAFIGSSKESYDRNVLDIVKENVTSSLDAQFDIEFLIDMSVDEVDAALSELPVNTIVFMLASTLPKQEGGQYSSAETARILSSITPHPIYTYWHSHIGHGALGGQIVTGHSQGKAAALLALEILDSPEKALPELRPAPSSFFFDLEEMKKRDIGEEALPTGTRFINYQAPIWQEYKTEALTTLVIIFGLISIVLAFFLLTKRQTETIHQISDENIELNNALEHNQEVLEDVTHQLEEITIVDELTGLMNERHFANMLDKELRRASRYKTPISLLLISLDDFENYTRNYGEEKANKAIAQIGHVFSNTCQRSSDVLAYLTHSQYAIILPHTSRDNALVVGEKLHSTLRDTNIPFVASKTGALTLSIGLASLEGTDERVNPQHMFNTSEVLRASAEKAGGNTTKADVIATKWGSDSSAGS